MTIIAQSNPVQKKVNGANKIITPLVFGEKYSFGVAYREESGVIFHWGLCIPKNLVQSWRAMKFLEAAKNIGRGTLCGCWYAASERHGKEYIEDLVRGFKTAEFKSLKRKITEEYPSEADFSAMLDRVLADGHCNDVIYELEAIIKEGKLPNLPQIAQIRELKNKEMAEIRARQPFREPL